MRKRDGKRRYRERRYRPLASPRLASPRLPSLPSKPPNPSANGSPCSWFRFSRTIRINEVRLINAPWEIPVDRLLSSRSTTAAEKTTSLFVFLPVFVSLFPLDRGTWYYLCFGNSATSTRKLPIETTLLHGLCLLSCNFNYPRLRRTSEFPFGEPRNEGIKKELVIETCSTPFFSLCAASSNS